MWFLTSSSTGFGCCPRKHVCLHNCYWRSSGTLENGNNKWIHSDDFFSRHASYLFSSATGRLAFFEEQGFSLGWPASLDSPLAYCVFMHEVGLCRSMMGGRLAAMIFYSLALGFPDLCRDFRVWKALEGGAQAVEHRWAPSLPVSPVMLQQLIEVLPAVSSSAYIV